MRLLYLTGVGDQDFVMETKAKLGAMAKSLIPQLIADVF